MASGKLALAHNLPAESIPSLATLDLSASPHQMQAETFFLTPSHDQDQSRQYSSASVSNAIYHFPTLSSCLSQLCRIEEQLKTCIGFDDEFVHEVGVNTGVVNMLSVVHLGALTQHQDTCALVWAGILSL